MKYCTKNAIGSADPRDLYDNAGNFDLAVNGRDRVWIDRLGRERLSWDGLQARFEQSIREIGFIPVGTFTDGATLALPGHILRAPDGEYYRWDGRLPKRVPAGSLPETTGGYGTGAWLSVGDATLRGQLSGPAGLSMIGDFDSMAQLRGAVPAYNGQKVYLRAYYSDTLTGGGYFVGYVSDTASVDDGGFTCIRVGEAAVWKRIHSGRVSFYDGGARHGSFDNAPILDNIQISALPLEIPKGYFTFRRGVYFAPNKSISLFGCGPHNMSSVFVYWPSAEDTASALLRVGIPNGEMTFSGITISGITFVGNDAERHGIELYTVGHVNIRNCEILKFKGAGLLLDKCQDGVVEYVGIQQCGRSRGDYTVLADVTNSELTEFSALHIQTSVPKDASNMLRFENMQVECNRCTPYIYVDSGIGLWFSKIHSEHRDGIMSGKGVQNGTWMRIGRDQNSNTEVFVDECQASQFEYLFEIHGYGKLTARANGRGAGIKARNQGTKFYVNLSDSNVSRLEFTDSIIARINNCQADSLIWNYPSRESHISNSTLGDVVIENTGASARVYFDDCYFSSVQATTSNLHFTGGRCTGDFKYRSQSGEGAVNRVQIDGTVDISTRYGTGFIPYIKTVYEHGTADLIINHNYFPDGSEWYNRDAQNAGDVYMQRKVGGRWVTTLTIPPSTVRTIYSLTPQSENEFSGFVPPDYG